MAGPLKNQGHEKFCLALFAGKPANAAYQEAGYQPDNGNCIRLRANPKIHERLAELQSEVAAEAKVSVESICRELDEANAVAKARGQAAPMVSASVLRAKLAGLLVERVEIGGPNEFAGCNTEAATVDKLIELTVAVPPVRQIFCGKQ
jgi:hypothetical protein